MLTFHWWFWLMTIGFARGQIKFNMNEEESVNYVVGNIFKRGLFGNSDSGDQLTILNPHDDNVDAFKIDSVGNLKLTRKIDRERICQKDSYQDSHYNENSVSINHKKCVIVIQVAAKGKSSIITIEIEVEDINDNKPMWKESPIKLKFRDGCKPRTRVVIPQATDLDSGRNGFIEYSISNSRKMSSNSNSNLPFRIVANDGLYLETITSLDREQRDRYELTLIAKDKGQISRTNEIDVIIIVEDINDNEPIFTASTFRFSPVAENCKNGTLVGHLKATDKDSGNNGKFYFKYAKSVPNIVRKYFALSREGEISVISPLDVDRGSRSYKFRVVVEDLAIPPYTLSSEASVQIDINDANDEPPELKVIFINKNIHNNQPSVLENAPLGSLVGILEAKDLDFNGKDSVTCKSENSNFNLMQNSQYYKYNVVTQVRFDREKNSSVLMFLSCHDLSNNIGTFKKTITITDVNDNPPVFTKPFYTAKIFENSPIGTRISETVKATDLDSDSFIRYQIMPGYQSNFSIHKEMGIITTKVVFDRELCSSYIIKVLATDSSKEPINTGTGTIQLIILDKNDNAPVFEQDSYTFNIMENNGLTDHNTKLTYRLRGRQRVGAVVAVDPDDENPNIQMSKPYKMAKKSVYYSLDRSADSRHFQINPTTGVISTVTALDRERQARYIFPVFADDSLSIRKNGIAGQMKHKVSATVTIVVDDVNDNKPKFIMPNATLNRFEIAETETVGHRIVQVHAVDPDAGENSIVHYNISHGNHQEVFGIDKTSGFLFLSRSLLDISTNQLKSTYILTVRACDRGRMQSLCSDFKNLRIVVFSGDKWSPNGAGPNGKNGYNGFGESGSLEKGVNNAGDNASGIRRISPHQEAIVICLAVLFVVLVIAAGSLVCLLRCKQNSNSHRNNAHDVSSLWSGKRTNSTANRTGMKDKRLYDCSSPPPPNVNYLQNVNTQMLATVDANLNNNNNNINTNPDLRNQFCGNVDKRAWTNSQMDMKSRQYGYAVDHTSRLDYQTLESLCLAASSNQMPQFIDPCNDDTRFQTMLPSTNRNPSSFYSQHDLKLLSNSAHSNTNSNNKNNIIMTDSNLHNPMEVDHPIISTNDINLYQTMEDSTHNNDQHNINLDKSTNNMSMYHKLNEMSLQNPTNSNYSNDHTLNTSTKVNNNNNNNNQQSKYATYLYNEASFV